MNAGHRVFIFVLISVDSALHFFIGNIDSPYVNIAYCVIIVSSMTLVIITWVFNILMNGCTGENSRLLWRCAGSVWFADFILFLHITLLLFLHIISNNFPVPLAQRLPHFSWSAHSPQLPSPIVNGHCRRIADRGSNLPARYCSPLTTASRRPARSGWNRATQ